MTRAVQPFSLLPQSSSLSEEIRLDDHWAELGEGRAGCRSSIACCTCCTCSSATGLAAAAQAADEASNDQQHDENADDDGGVGLELK